MSFGSYKFHLVKGVAAYSLVAMSIKSNYDASNYYEKYRSLPVLLTIAIITKPQVKTYRKWISQLKVTVVESVQKTIFADKLLNPELFTDFPFNFALQNLEDPIDCMDFLLFLLK